MAEIRVDKLTKTFGPVIAVDDLTFTFPEGSITCLLGPSGCGKTTLLRMIAGLETPTEGSIFFGDREVTGLPPRKRNIGMVFQYPVVYRGISVYRNIELPLKTRGLSESERRERVREIMEILDLTAMADKSQEDLDNVTRQKVAVARAVAYRPDIILFDEPMTNIDANSKIQFKQAFKTLTKRLNQVIVYVTHDQTEAMTFADQIALMEEGRIVQCNTPRKLYGEPEDIFGGWFLGNPGMNFLTASCDQPGPGSLVRTALLPGPLKTDTPPKKQELTVGIRPEHIRLGAEPKDTAVPARVRHRSITIGGQYLFTLEVGGQEVKAKIRGREALGLDGQEVWMEIDPDRVILFDENKNRIAG